MSWFSFENRCLICGDKMATDDRHRGLWNHLQMHHREGVLNEDMEQIKPHPTGFPGPPLGQKPAL